MHAARSERLLIKPSDRKVALRKSLRHIGAFGALLTAKSF